MWVLSNNCNTLTIKWVFQNRGPSLAHRYDSYMNYQELFSEILNQHNQSPVNLKLPEIWLWDIVDEFVYQFQAFCLYKANPGKRSAEELEDLETIENTQNVRVSKLIIVYTLGQVGDYSSHF